MTTTAPPAVTFLITAAELHRGDIVLRADTTRWFAAFDVSTPVDPTDGNVRVWTAVADTDRGIPATIDFTPGAPLTVDRRTGGPTVTRTTITVPFDDRPFPYTAR